MPCYGTKGNMCMPLKIRFVGLFVNAGYRKVNLELWSKKDWQQGLYSCAVQCMQGLYQKVAL